MERFPTNRKRSDRVRYLPQPVWLTPAVFSSFQEEEMAVEKGVCLVHTEGRDEKPLGLG
jgi:hypothetical protein